MYNDNLNIEYDEVFTIDRLCEELEKELKDEKKRFEFLKNKIESLEMILTKLKTPG